MKDKIIEKVNTLNDNQLEKTEKFLNNLTEEKKLPQILQKKLDTIKTNPLVEPKIATKQEEIQKAIDEGTLTLQEAPLEILEAIYSIEEIESLEEEHNLEIGDLILMGNEVAEKVFSYTEKIQGNEVYKEIETQNSLKPVKYSKKREIRDVYKKYGNLIQELTFLYKKSENALSLGLEKELENIKKELESLQDKVEQEEKILNQKVNDAHDLDTSTMSEWEKELLKQKVIANCFGNYMPPMGKK